MPLWREIQKQTFTNVSALIDFLELDEENRKKVVVKSHFPLNLPLRLAQKIKKNHLNDPILLQFVPLTLEERSNPLFSSDPLQESNFCKEPKLLHKYEGRALLVATSACAMHCRYCFRKSFPYEKQVKGYEKELAYIAADPSISEIILSGGDPLSLSNEALKELFNAIEAIAHIKRIRFHTRFPIGIPERIDEEFLDILKKSKCQVWFITHCNHPLELDSDVLAALKQIQHLGIPVINQSVLLKGVNDDATTLGALCNRLIDAGILPYYLHQLDPVEGAGHFNVPEERGKQLIAELASKTSGYGVPRYVKEIPGAAGKTELV